MTVQTSNNVATFDGNGVTTAHPFNFKFFEGRDLIVLLIDRATRETKTLVLNSDFTVQGAGGESGGSVTTAIAPPTGKVLRVSRELKITQDTSLRNQGKFLAEVHEDVFDKQVMISQQLQEQIDRAIKIPVDGTGTGDELVEQLFDARDIAVQSAAEAEAIAEKFGDVDQAITVAEEAALTAGVAAFNSAASAAQASTASSVAQAAADSAQTSADIYPDIATGLAATPPNGYFSVVSPESTEYLVLYLKSNGAAIEQKRYPSAQIDSLTINVGKSFPLKQMSRGGVVSPANTVLNRLLLDIKVIGDAKYLEGKYFRIAYFQNDADISGNADQGIVLEEFSESSFVPTGTAITIHNHTNTPAAINRSGGVQTFTVIPELRRKLLFIITIDAAALPPAGTPINAQTSGNAGYSWIIEQSAYCAVRGMGNTLTINKDDVFPQAERARNGAVSTIPVAFMATLLDVQVLGARQGKLYRVAYFKNGSTALPGPSDGWIFEEFDETNYETAPNPALTVVNFLNPAPNIVRSGIQTVTIESPVVLGLSFKVTLDTAALPPYGNHINGNASGQPGYSYIIDPQRYFFATSSVSGESLPVQWSLDSTNTLRVAWASKGRCFRIGISPSGVNQLPNLISVEGAPGSDLSAAVWVNIGSTGSDWLPPMQVMAASGGDGGSVAFTGGAHGSSGGAEGDPTAINKLYQCFADGKPISNGQSGTADHINIQVINEIQGYNTKTLGRYIARQSFSILISPGGMTVEGNVYAMEDIAVRRDYGLQILSNGFRGTQLVLGGSNTARIPFSLTDNDSGLKSSNPDAWAIVLQEPANGQMALWLDKEYGAGDGSYVIDSEPLLRGAATGKWYLGVVLSTITGRSFSAGTGYKYRAGISWQAPGMQPASFDSIIAMHMNGKQTFAYGMPDAKSVRVS